MTISNIQVAVNCAQGGVTGKLIVYDVTRGDNSIDRIHRTWHVYGVLQEKGKRPGVNGQIIEKAPPNLLPILQKFAVHCESKVGDKRFSNVNIHLCGALVAKKQIKAPPAKPPYVTATHMVNVQQANEAQVKQLQVQVDALNKKLDAEKASDAAILHELEITKARLADLEGFLKEGLKIYKQAKAAAIAK